MYLSWAAFYEGSSDSAYFNVLIPRVLEDILRREGVRPYNVGLSPAVEFGITRRSVAEAAEDICSRRNEFHLVIIHADAGSRGQRERIATRREAFVDAAAERCGFDRHLAVLLSPVRELEAWALSDRDAVCTAFGLRRLPDNLLPDRPVDVERIADPKQPLAEISSIAGRRRGDLTGILVRVAQEQRISLLRQVRSFQDFEISLKSSLRHVGCI